MKKYRFKGLLQNDGWREDVSVAVDEKGLVQSISQDHGGSERVNGLAIPGFQNAHSHAFQYAMAGLAEQHKPGKEADDFWSWRETMYQIALTLSSDELESIATMLYAEMLRHGYTHVAEFHYLHHDKDGNPYHNQAELGNRLIAAAQKAGIKITLVPMFYQKGGFSQDPGKRQRRFISKTIDDYYRLLEVSCQVVKTYDGASIGHGVHSLRAVDPQDVKTMLQSQDLPGPFHMHIAEQRKEVEDFKSYLGKRPVEWLLDNAPVNSNYHLVHATHLTDTEIEGIAKSGAHVVLCPSTEGNLGDGIFLLRRFLEFDGKWSIGTDSHIGLNPCEELRILDYGQRLTSHKRNTYESDSGMYSFNQSLLSGRAAVGDLQRAYFEVGKLFNAVIYDADVPLLTTSSNEYWLSTIIYASDVTWIKGTIVSGIWVVKDQQHHQFEEIRTKFVSALRKLKIR